MIHQQINAKKYLYAFWDLMKADDTYNPRFSILDLITLIEILEHEGASNNDLSQIMYNVPASSHSSLDRPLARLIHYGLIDKSIDMNAATKSGRTRTSYKVSDKGLEFLKRCKL